MSDRLLRIQEVAEATGLTPRSIRYYEEIGLLHSVRRIENGKRVFTDDDVRRLGHAARFEIGARDIGIIAFEGGIEAAYRRDLEEADDPVKLRAEIEERLNRVRSPFRTAEKFGIEEIIDPRDTRRILCEFANLVAPLRTTGMRGAGYRP